MCVFILSFKYKSLNGHSSVLNPSPHVTRKHAEVNKAELLSSRGRDQHGESFMYIFTRCCYDEIINNNRKRKGKKKGFFLDISTTLLYTQVTVNMTVYSESFTGSGCLLHVLAAG